MALIADAHHLTGIDRLPEGSKFDLITEKDKLMVYTPRNNSYINLSSINDLSYEEKEFAGEKRSILLRAIGFGVLGLIVCFVVNIVFFVLPIVGFAIGAVVGAISALNGSSSEKHLYCQLSYLTNTKGIKTIAFTLPNTQKNFVAVKEMIAELRLNN